MGSESDLPVMRKASDTLLQFEVAHEIKIVSAHRTVHEMISYAEGAKERGLEVIIAGAGGASSPTWNDCFSYAIAGHWCPY